VLNYGGGISISHPFIRSRARNLSVHGTFDITDDDIEQNAAPFNSDYLRVFRLGASYNFADTLLQPATNLVAAEVSQGVNILGASQSNSPLLSRPGAGPVFTKLTANASRQQPVTDHISVLLAATGQYAKDMLLPAEQFGFGGTDFGRGYDPSQLLGDSGIAAKIELQYTDTPTLSWLQGYQFYVFYDAGRVSSQGLPLAGQTLDRSATSTGAGVRVNVTDWASGFIEGARQLTSSAANPGESGNGSRFFFGVRTQF
jgi:hemolysin activation/secretion protein